MQIQKQIPLALLLVLVIALAKTNGENIENSENDWIPIPDPSVPKQVVPRKAEGRVLNVAETNKDNFFPENSDYKHKLIQQQSQYLVETTAPRLRNNNIRPSEVKPNRINKQTQNVARPSSDQYYQVPNIQLPTLQPLQYTTPVHHIQYANLNKQGFVRQQQYQVPVQQYSGPLQPQPYQNQFQQFQPNPIQQIQYTTPVQPLLQFPNQQFIPQPQVLNQQLLSGGQTYFVAPSEFPPNQYLGQPFNGQGNSNVYQPSVVSTTPNYRIPDNTTLFGSDIENINKVLQENPKSKVKSNTKNEEEQENESVQLLYVPLETLTGKGNIQNANSDQSNQLTNPTSQATPLQYHFSTLNSELDRNTGQQLPQHIEKDFIQQALDAHRLQLQLRNENKRQPISSTIKPPRKAVSPTKKRKPHQPPLAVYMGADKQVSIADVLSILKHAKTIDVQDSIGPETPQVFVGPANLEPPEGYAKFELPYLSNIDSNRVERKVDQYPFFVAPLSYKTPPGYAKIPLPSPHVGSVVVSQKEILERTSTSTPTSERLNIPTDDVKPVTEFRVEQSQPPSVLYSTTSRTPSTTRVYSQGPQVQTINQYELEQINNQFLPQRYQYQYQEQLPAQIQQPHFDTIPQTPEIYSKVSSTTPVSEIRKQNTKTGSSTPRPTYKSTTLRPSQNTINVNKYSLGQNGAQELLNYQTLFSPNSHVDKYGQSINLQPGETYHFIDLPQQQPSSQHQTASQKQQSTTSQKQQSTISQQAQIAQQQLHSQSQTLPQQQTASQHQQNYQYVQNQHVNPLDTQVVQLNAQDIQLALEEQEKYQQQLKNQQETDSYKDIYSYTDKPAVQNKNKQKQRQQPSRQSYKTRNENQKSQDSQEIQRTRHKTPNTQSSEYQRPQIQNEYLYQTQQLTEVNQPKQQSTQQSLPQHLPQQYLIESTAKVPEHQIREEPQYVVPSKDQRHQQYLVESTSASANKQTSRVKSKPLQENIEYYYIDNPQPEQPLKSVRPQKVQVNDETDEASNEHNSSPAPQTTALPSIISNLQDQSLRPLLVPASIAPTSESFKKVTPQYEVTSHNSVTGNSYTTTPSTYTATRSSPVSSTVRYSTTTSQPETTTRRNLRGRHRGGSRFSSSSTTTSIPRRGVSRTRKTTTPRTRYTTENSEETYANIDSQRTQVTRQRFKTRGRPLKTEITERVSNVEVTESALPKHQPQLLGGFQTASEIPQRHHIQQTSARNNVPITVTPTQEQQNEQYLIDKYQQIYSVPYVSSTDANVYVQETQRYEPKPQKQAIYQQAAQQEQVAQHQQYLLPQEQYQQHLRSRPTTRVSTEEPQIISQPQGDAQYVRFRSNVEPKQVPQHRFRNEPTTKRTVPKIKVPSRTRPTTTQRTTTTTESVQDNGKEEFYGFFRQPNFEQPTAVNQAAVDSNVYERAPLYSAPVSPTPHSVIREQYEPVRQHQGKLFIFNIC